MAQRIRFDEDPDGVTTGVPNEGARGGDLAPPSKLRRYDLARMRKSQPPEADFVVAGLAARGEVSVIWGPGGIGKSMLVEACARGVGLGETIAGLACKKGRVLYFDAENGEYEVHRRVHSLGLPPSRVAIYDASASVHLEHDYAEISSVVEAEQPDLVVFDSLRRLTGGSEENDSHDMAEAIGAMKRIAQHADTAVVVIHHSRKDGTAFRGSSAIRDQVSISWQMGREEKDLDRSRRFLRCDKMRIGPEPEDLWLHIVHEPLTGSVEIVGSEEPGLASLVGKTQASTSVARQIVDALADGAMTRPEVCEVIGRSSKDGTVRRTFKELEEKGAIRQVGGRRWEGVPKTTLGTPELAPPEKSKGAKRGATGGSSAPSTSRKRGGA